MNKIRILVADDHAVVREGIVSLLRGQADIDVAAQAASTDELLRKAIETRPDVVLLDLSMPTTGGLAAVQDLKRHGIDSRCLVLTMHDDPAMIRSALAAGVSGYLVKGVDFEEVGAAIRTIHRGRSYFGVSLHDRLLPELVPPSAAGPVANGRKPLLSRREQEVLRLLGLGYTYRAISAQLNVSEKSVETYRARLSAKLGLKNRADLVRYALETGIFEEAKLGTAHDPSGLSAPPPDPAGDEDTTDAGPGFEEKRFARDLRIVFQPILEVSSRQRLFALECLSRGPAGTPLESADRLFGWIRALHREEPADQICIEQALQRARYFPGMPLLSVNVHACTLASAGFVETFGRILDKAGLTPSRLMVEIVEHGGDLQVHDLLHNVEQLRTKGIRIAIDDFGLGQSNFQRLLEVRPDFLKIERYFVDDWSSDHRKMAVIESIARLARRLGTQIIAEGIENADQLEMVCSHGIELVQGFFFSPPIAGQELLQSGILAARERQEPRATALGSAFIS
jgi:EAL domain-containing protein (putative c-di-GMP-specific phosphodiesterase class I)/DNA-binding NarL/FixJ family response regulator